MPQTSSKKSLRAEPEYISSNNHRPFKDSQEVIHKNRHREGPSKCNLSHVAINGALSKEHCSNATKYKKPADEKKPSGTTRQNHHRKGRYQVHLKREDGDLNEAIEYK